MYHTDFSPAVAPNPPTPSTPAGRLKPYPTLTLQGRPSPRKLRPSVYHVAGLARESGVDPAAIRRRIKDGRIRARRIGKWLAIHRREAQRWMEGLAK